VPAKRQLLLEFDDGFSLVGYVKMYGAVWAFPEGEFRNSYYLGPKHIPSPLTDEFDCAYFKSLLEGKKSESLSKGFPRDRTTHTWA